MSTIVIGDIHGNVLALRDLLAQIQPQAGDDDVVVFLGDYIDRGPDTRGCIETILSFRGSCRARVVCLRGNHEDWMLRTQADYTRHSWLLGMEAFDTIRSYSVQAEDAIRGAVADAGLQLYVGPYRIPYDSFFDVMPAEHRRFFNELELWFQSADCICVHAGLDPDIPELSDQPPRSLIWGHADFPAKYQGAIPVVYGHWNNADLSADGRPTPHATANTIGIDTIAHGVLTAIRMPGRRVFQSDRYRVSEDTVNDP